MALRCYRCGQSLVDLSLPLTRLDECPSCGVQLHVCRLCECFAANIPTSCSEDDAIEVGDKKAANFCDYFKPSDQAYNPDEIRGDLGARADLVALFGTTVVGAGQAPDDAQAAPGTAGEEALEKAKSLFK